MSRAERAATIKELETVCDSPVITYVTGDRHPVISAQISDDAIRVLYRHLEAIGHQNRINLFLYTRGGMLVAPPRIVHLFREYADTFYTLVPYRAHSAGTSICLGADGIVMGKMGELSPVDPSTANPFNPQAVQGDPRNLMTKIPISVEDVTAYLSLAAEKANLISEAQKIEVFRALTSKIDPIALGSVHRVYNIIRSLTPELLAFQLKGVEEKTKIPEITKALTEIYTHDYLISRDIAKRIGLKVIIPETQMESTIWKLYEIYEKDLHLREIFDPEELLGTQDSTRITCDVAFIESTHRGDVFPLEVSIRRRPPTPVPQMPPGLPMPVAPRPPPEEVTVKLKAKGWQQIIEDRGAA
jgi:hypothetical protein